MMSTFGESFLAFAGRTDAQSGFDWRMWRLMSPLKGLGIVVSSPRFLVTSKRSLVRREFHPATFLAPPSHDASWEKRRGNPPFRAKPEDSQDLNGSNRGMSTTMVS